MRHQRNLLIHFLLCLIMQIIFISCKDENIPDLDFRQEMRDFVIGISEYSKSLHPAFIIIPQNGIELINDNGEAEGSLNNPYLDAIDGHGQEDLFYGYEEDDLATPADDNEYLMDFLNRSKDEGKVILVTDYCSNHGKMDDSYARNREAGYVSFAADHRELDDVPVYPTVINRENDLPITDLGMAKNFLYLINYQNYTSKAEFINAVAATNYDLLIIDLFFDENTAFTIENISDLKFKANGGMRMILCYMSIGEAEDYRYYWQQGWKPGNPSWIEVENPDWEGNYKVRFWEPEWQDIIYGNDDSYLKKILDAGFDGAYLDIIDAFEYFE